MYISLIEADSLKKIDSTEMSRGDKKKGGIRGGIYVTECF